MRIAYCKVKTLNLLPYAIRNTPLLPYAIRNTHLFREVIVKKSLSILAVLTLLPAMAQNSISGTVSIPAKLQLKNIVVWLCKATDSACLQGPFKMVKLSGNGQKASYQFSGLAAGQYAVWAFHDKGGDGIYAHGGDEEIAPYTKGHAKSMHMGNHSMVEPTLVSAGAKNINIEIKGPMR